MPFGKNWEELLDEASGGEPPSRGKVLVVEDNRDAADSLCLLLGIWGHEVRVAYSGPAGVAAAAEWLPEAVVSDLGLPGLDGFGVARQVRDNPRTAHARLIAMTGYDTERDRVRARESGFDHYLTKPAQPYELRKLLNRK